MTYDKAFEIGSAATGYVKCTYARLYNAENGVMFSLQHNDIIGVTNVNTDARITFDIDLPVVEAVGYIPGNRSVPVRLTTAARDLIRTKLRNYKRTRTVLRTNIYVKCWTKAAMPDYLGSKWNLGQIKKVRTIEGAEQNKVRAQFYPNHELRAELYRTEDYPEDIRWFRYYWEEEKTTEPIESVANLLRVVENREICYVPASAIDWIPDNIENATVINPTTGTEIKLSDRIADAKKKVENAKAILAMAATTIII